MKQSRLLLGAAIIAAVVMGATGCTGESSPSPEQSSANAAAQADATYKDAGGLTRYKSPIPLSSNIATRGPDGEVPVWYNTLSLTKAEVAKVRAAKYRAAIVWHLTSPFMSALTTGAKKTFGELGIDVVSESSAEGDDAKLQNNIQTALALKPDIILTIALDPVADAAAFKPAVDAGVKMVFVSVKPTAYKPGSEYTSLVTYDLAGLGQVTADALGQGVNKQAKVGVIYYDANFYVTNQREAIFAQTLSKKYPNVQVVDRVPMSDPSKVEDVATAMIARHPDIKAIFAPWDTAAEGVVAALRQLGREDVKVYTIDLGNTNVLEMAKGGIVKEMTSTLAVEFGSTAAIAGTYGVLGKQAPPMVIVPAFPVTKDNLGAGWEATFGDALPADIKSALGQQ
jgi:ribose transport system substrate-binding protein